MAMIYPTAEILARRMADELDQLTAENVALRRRNEEQAEQIAMLRTGDTCARQCEGTAYRIRCRQLEAQIAEMEARS